MSEIKVILIDKIMIWVGYWTTFITYIVTLGTHTTLAYSKAALQQTYDLPVVVLGCIDGALYLGYVTGYIFRYVMGQFLEKYVNFTIYSSLSAILFAGLALPSLFNMESGNFLNLALLVLCFLIGLLQMPYYPTFYLFITRYLSNEYHGCQIGFWAASISGGLIFGYLFSALVTGTLSWSWEFSFLILALLQLVSTIVSGVIMNKKHNENHRQSVDSIPISCSQYTQFVKDALTSLRHLHYLFTLSLMKSSLMILSFWLPIYLQDKQMNKESFLFPILFHVSSMIGSTVIGRLYETTKGLCLSCEFLDYFLISLCCLSSICLAVLSYVSDLGSGALLIILLVLGFIMGGGFASYQANEILLLTGSNVRLLAMVYNLGSTTANFLIALLSLVLGICLEVGSSNSQMGETSFSEFSVFLPILFWGSVILIFMLAARLCFVQEKHKHNRHQNFQLEDAPQ